LYDRADIIKCSCLNAQILREMNLGQTTGGGPQKLNPCSWGGGGQENNIDVEKLPAYSPIK
jgi:hypothetical protein